MLRKFTILITLLILAFPLACGDAGSNDSTNNNSTNNNTSNNSTTENNSPSEQTNHEQSENNNNSDTNSNNNTPLPSDSSGHLLAQTNKWHLLNIESGEQVGEAFRDDIYLRPDNVDVAWTLTPDGKEVIQIASRHSQDAEVPLISAYNLETGEGRDLLRRDTEAIDRHAFAPHVKDGKVYFLGGAQALGYGVYYIDLDGDFSQEPTLVFDFTDRMHVTSFEVHSAKWNPSGTHIVSAAFGCTDSNCDPRNIGILSLEDEEFIQVTEHYQAFFEGGAGNPENNVTFAQSEHGRCNGCDVKALNGGKMGDHLWQWLDDSRIVYWSNRDMWNSSEDGVKVENGEAKLLIYDLNDPKPFPEQEVYDTMNFPIAVGAEGIYAAEDKHGIQVQGVSVYDAEHQEMAKFPLTAFGGKAAFIP